MTPTADDRDFEELLNYLKRARGFDFTGYKRSSLMRRISKRMQMVQMDGYTDYVDFLEVHPEEFSHLFNTILINVTSFFRDPPLWDYLASDVIPQILGRVGPDGPIRVWVAGCSSGQEAYTAAILLAEALGDDAFRERVKIYATDADEEALNQARLGSYGEKEVESVPPTLRHKYFAAANGGCAFRKNLRRQIIFGRHDLIQDAPISRIDLLTCRNTLMYFNAEAQGRILTRFHFGLSDHGFLFLGKSETLLTRSDLFTPVDLKRRVFAKSFKNGPRERLMINHDNYEDVTVQQVADARLLEAAFDLAPVAEVVVDVSGRLAAANLQARALFGLAPGDIGRPLQDLELSYRPAELRSLIEQAYAGRVPVGLKDVTWQTSADTRSLDLQVVPLTSGTRGPLGVSIAFADATLSRRMEKELRRSNEELETATEELQATVEELETTNEELQSTNEELETTNEELQSTNEELETINEELQSTNEEMETMNEELRQRGGELDQVNGFLAAILTGLRVGVVVLDRDLRIHAWNRQSEDLWGLRADEVTGTNFMNLDIGLRVERLRQPVRACLASEDGGQEVTLEAVNRRGKAIRCRVNCTPLIGDGEIVQGAILLMEESDGGPAR